MGFERAQPNPVFALGAQRLGSSIVGAGATLLLHAIKSTLNSKHPPQFRKETRREQFGCLRG